MGKKLPTVTINAIPEEKKKIKEIFTIAIYEGYMKAVREGKTKLQY